MGGGGGGGADPRWSGETGKSLPSDTGAPVLQVNARPGGLGTEGRMVTGEGQDCLSVMPGPMSHPALTAFSPRPLLPQPWRRGVAVVPEKWRTGGRGKGKEGLSAWGDSAGVGDWGAKGRGKKN